MPKDLEGWQDLPPVPLSRLLTPTKTSSFMKEFPERFLCPPNTFFVRRSGRASGWLSPWLGGLLAGIFLAGCEKPAEPEMPFPPPPPPAETPVAFVPIPEEFQTPSQEPPAPTTPATPRILFTTKAFQVTNKSGIQGIQIGETVNLLRETDDEYIVQYGDLEFIKEKSFFSATFVSRQEVPTVPAPAGGEAGSEPAIPAEPIPAAEQAAAGEIIGLAAPVLAAEPALPGESQAAGLEPLPPMTAEEKRMADLTDAIRDLNERIRAAQQKAEVPGNTPSRAERRALEQMKGQRDELSRQLTLIGKP